MDWKRTFGGANTTLASNGASVHKTERVGEMVNLSLTMLQEHNHKPKSAVYECRQIIPKKHASG